MDLEHLLNSTVDIILTRGFTVEHLDRECTTRNGKRWCGSIEIGEFLRVHSGRCNDQFEITTPGENFRARKYNQSITKISEFLLFRSKPINTSVLNERS
jgi:hypothetical protein